MIDDRSIDDVTQHDIDETAAGMTNSRTMKVAVLALVASMGNAFITPAPRAKVSAGPGAGAGSGNRGETSAVSPLNIAGFSLSSITDIFTREWKEQGTSKML